MIRMSAAEYRALGLPPMTRLPAAAASQSSADNEGPVHRSVLDILRLRLGARYLVQHTPNRPRSRVQGGREKRLGAVRGWPDLAVYGPGPAGPACWFVEIKPPGAPVPSYQREIHAQLRAAGFEVRVLRGIADAEAALALWGIPTRT
ncbi:MULTISPECIES: hypothetical protein [unclassified Methylobacterium]|uniref:hypothetical protein n=1 Tax=unclassified Methylobacterium TaxID=2615210 RepID=UPI002269ADA8|nr:MULTISPECIES: hypothetical protein [unclassified Methylobacterium]